MAVLVTCKFDKCLFKNEVAIPGQHFPHYVSVMSMGAFVAMETSFDPICPKTYCCLSPSQMMLHIKFELV